jgi:hypothetical protein
LQAAAEIAPLMTQSLNFGRLMLMLVARLKEKITLRQGARPAIAFSSPASCKIASATAD